MSQPRPRKGLESRLEIYLLKSPVVYNWTNIWTTISITVAAVQIMLLMAPNDKYWLWYHTSSDVLELALTLALFSATSYTKVALKMVVSGLVSWQFYCVISNAISDYITVMIDLNSVLTATFVTAALVVGWLVRFSAHWRPGPTDGIHSKFYEVIGRPSNLPQLGVAMYTGRGGSFAVTDGADLWCYSRQDGCMIRKKLNPGYIIGTMNVEICAVTGDKYQELDSMTGKPFSLLHNCLELQALARKWR